MPALRARSPSRSTKRTPGTQPIAATTFAARAATLSAAISKSARLSESARRRIRSTSGSWDGVRVGDLVAVGRATSYTRDVEVAAVRHDDRNVRLTLVDYPEELYAGELPLGDFRPGDSIPGPYLGPACPVIRSIHTGVDDIGQDRAGTNPILLRIEIEPDDSSRPAARTYIVQCRQATVAGIKPTATEDDDPVLQGQPDDEYYEQPGTDWQDCGVVERPGVGTLILSSGFSIGERIDIRVIALDDEGRASCWRVYEDYLVELPVAAAPGARLHFGEIDPEAAPDDAIGQNGDRFIADDGRTWVKVDGAWVFQGDFTADDGTKIYSGEVAEDALPPGDIGKEGDLYFAFDGRWWEKTDETTWTPRGDLTGPAGPDIFTGSGEPQPGLGKDGDVYVSDDGIVWRKAGGVWTQTGVDLTGKPGATLHSGEVADGAKPPAGLGNVDDVFLASDGRWWQKTADATWTLRGDLTGPAGSATFTGSGDPQAGLGKNGDVYVSDDGIVWRKAGGVWTQTGVDLTGKPGATLHSGEVADGAKPPAGLGNVDDVYFASDGRWWQKTADATWTLRGDLTGPAGSATFTGSGDPQAGLGKDGDVYVSDDGIVWRKAGGVWTQTGVDLTGKPGATLHSGEVADGAKPPAGLGNVDFSGRRLLRQRRPLVAEDGRRDLDAARRPDGTRRLRHLHRLRRSAGRAGQGRRRLCERRRLAQGRRRVDPDRRRPHRQDGMHSGEVADGAKPPAASATSTTAATVWQKTADDRDRRDPPPSPAPAIRRRLGKDGDVYVSEPGARPAACGPRPGVDLTGKPGATLHSGEVADGAKPPAGLGNVDDVYFASDGRWWQKTADATWTLRGDLTGPAGSATFTGSGDPQAGLGKDGDVYVSDDGTLWTRANGVWIYSGVDLTGLPGSKIISGDLAEGASPSPSLGNVEDIFFNLDGRVWEKTDDTTWTFRGDLTGPPGTNLIPGVVAPGELPPANVGMVGDTFLAADGRFWKKTDATTWTYIDDLTGPPGGGINPRGAWRSGTSYAVSDEVYRNFQRIGPPQSGVLRPTVTRYSIAYLCKLAHTADASNAPSGNGNDQWDALLGGGGSEDEATTETQTIYRRAASTPATPSGTAEAIPSRWSTAQPSPTATLGVYRSQRTVTNDADGTFESATAWSTPMLVPGQGPTGMIPPDPIDPTNSVTRYRLASRTPATPSSSTENPPSGWLSSQPSPHATLSIYKLVGTRTYRDGVFQSAVWVVTLVRGPVIVTTTEFTGYRRASRTPATPSSSTENPPSGWRAARPLPHVTLSIYKLVGTRTYHDDVFQSAVWAVTLEQGPIGSGVTTTSVTRYRRAASTPATPSSSTENPPSGWSATTPPSPTTTQGVYKLVGTRTYHDDVFQSAVWAVTLVRGPIIVTTTSVTRYRLASSTPATPSSSTENPPSGWLEVQPDPHATQSIYKLVGTRTYHDDVFQSAVWAVTFVRGPIVTVGPAVPSGLSITAVSTTVKGVTTNLTSCSWSSVSGADKYSYQIQNTTTDGSALGSTPNTYIATSSLGISDGNTVRFRVRSHDTVAGTYSNWSGWVSTTVT